MELGINLCKLESHSCFSVLPPHDKGNAGRIHDHCKLYISITLFKRTRFVGTAVHIFFAFLLFTDFFWLDIKQPLSFTMRLPS